jgi:hypothetical protein
MLQFPIRQIISSTAKKAEITTTYKGRVVTRHVIRMANGWQGHHPDANGVRVMKMVTGERDRLAASIAACEKIIQRSSTLDEDLSRVKNQLANLRLSFESVKPEADQLEKGFPEFVIYGN